MKKIFVILLLFCALLCHAGESFRAFHVTQDKCSRVFRVLQKDKTLGYIVNSDYAILDFYDEQKNKTYTNSHDFLFDTEGNCIAIAKILSDIEWFWERDNLLQASTEVEIFSEMDELLVKFGAEGDGKCFIFRDPINQDPLAIALWKWFPVMEEPFLWFNRYYQDWEVIIIDQQGLKERNISDTILIWTLMKHSQKHFPSPIDVKYQPNPPES